MSEPILCKICGKRRAKRECPAANGAICSICCGTHREVEFVCPLECEYLQEAHQHDAPIAIPEPGSFPDILVTEDFIAQHEELTLFCVYSLLEAAFRAPGAADGDVLDALDALIRTQQTLQSGLVYEHVSPNSIAASIQRSFQHLWPITVNYVKNVRRCP